MKNNKQHLYGFVLISIGILLLIFVGGPMLLHILALGLGLYLINYGLLLRGNPSLFMMAERTIEEIRIRYFR